MLDIVIFSSDSFMPRTNVCINSVKEHIPNSKVHLVKVNNTTGNYVEGLAKDRLIYTKNLIKAGSKEVMVLGADCVFYNSPDEFLTMEGTVLVPHVITPPKNNASFYKTGHVNSDIMLFRKESIPLLNWLIDSEIKEDPSNGSFFDQTLLSSTPFFFDNINICKDETINYAYFNISERKLTIDNKKYYINNKQLTMFQTSGYILGKPEKASKYFSGKLNETELKLFQEYERLICENT